MKKLLILAVALVVMTAVPAHANFFTLYQSDLLNAVELTDNPAGSGSLDYKAPVGSDGAFFSGTFARNAISNRYIGIGVPSGSLLGFDSYLLSLESTDQLDWQVALFVDIDGVFYDSPFQNLSSYGTASLNFDLTTIPNLANADSVGFSISTNRERETFPGSGIYQSEIYNVIARPIPEPATLGLLGFGLLGLMGFRKKQS